MSDTLVRSEAKTKNPRHVAARRKGAKARNTNIRRKAEAEAKDEVEANTPKQDLLMNRQHT